MSKSQKISLNVIPFASVGKVDYENRRIYGATAMATGEAQGHRKWADDKTLHMMASLANARKYPVMMRFGHPGMSDNAFGKKLAKAYNFRVSGSKLLHDIEFMQWAKLSPVFSSDPVEYVMNRADVDPTSFGESVVIDAELVWVLEDGTEIDEVYEDEDGYKTRRRPKNSLYDYPVMRPVKFQWVDFVGDGALTPDGMFSESAGMWKEILDDTSSEIAMEAFRLLRNFQMRYKLTPQELSLKVSQLMGKYTLWEGFQMSNTPEERQEPVEAGQPESTPEPAPEQAENPLASVLAESEALAGTPVADGETAGAPESSDFVSREEYDALAAQNAFLQEQIQQQAVQLQQLTTGMQEYMKNINAAMQHQNRRIDAIEAEDIVTETAGFSRLGQLQVSVPGNLPVPSHLQTRHADDIAAASQQAFEPVTVPESPFEKALKGQPHLNS